MKFVGQLPRLPCAKGAVSRTGCLRDCYRSTILHMFCNSTSACRTSLPSRLCRATSLYTREALMHQSTSQGANCGRPRAVIVALHSIRNLSCIQVYLYPYYITNIAQTQFRFYPCFKVREGLLGSGTQAVPCKIPVGRAFHACPVILSGFDWARIQWAPYKSHEKRKNAAPSRVRHLALCY